MHHRLNSGSESSNRLSGRSLEDSMKRLPNPVILPLTPIGAASAFAADIAFFEQDGFRGRAFPANQTIPNNRDPSWPH